ncbi:hypothetical protein GCM10009678_72370 [Actinomadura kijaniata]|uniref:Uncharacterized protein n=1 Tax=Actinomadura namibiensis TaxID=182080 RepID=A0A7W3QRC0_ACTNM|nr:hypothetical protein [Actinomadura namibiensis]MBA8956579.1 hypothetical protein [Actinomadura namibiensis]
MSSLLGSPRALRGAIFAVDATAPGPRAVVFQYNPDAITRSLTPRGGGSASGGTTDVHRVFGAPIETISLTVEVDAADQPTAVPGGAIAGIAGQLAALELLLHQPVSRVIANTALLLAGTIEILPAESPLTLLVLGPARAVPVRLESLSVTEEAFDQLLNPIRARVELRARVLSYSDLPPSNAGYALFLVHQVGKEILAATAVAARPGV